MRFAGSAALGLLLLAGCAGRIREAGPAKVAVAAQAQPEEGRPFEVVPSQSLLTILVYRGGTLARMGHNHVVASHDLSGTVYVPQDLTRASFEVRFPVAALTIDESGLRAEAGADFPPEVPEAAKEGTRHNMLGEALLDAQYYPEIVLRSGHIDVIAPDALSMEVRVTVKDQTRSVTVLVHYKLTADALDARGEFSLKHSELGLTPFSAMLGALQVMDEMQVRFRLHFAASSASSAPAP